MWKRGFILLADQWDEGWRADVDGREAKVWRADHAFRAVEVPAGVSHVHFRYEPRSFRYGCYAALAGVMVLMVSFGSGLRRRFSDVSSRAVPREGSRDGKPRHSPARDPSRVRSG